MTPWSRAVKTPTSVLAAGHLPFSAMSNSTPAQGGASGHSQGCCPVLPELRQGPGPQGVEEDRAGPHSKACSFFLASLGGGGGGGGSSKLHINVEESVDGKVVSSRKREI